MEIRRATALAILALCVGEKNLGANDKTVLHDKGGDRRAIESISKKPSRPIVIYSITNT
jgi:hypothetical protein